MFWERYGSNSVHVTMEDGRGSATYAVTAANPMAFAASPTLEGIAARWNAAKNAQKEAEKAGSCGFQPNLQGKDILNDDDITALAARVKTARAAPSK